MYTKIMIPLDNSPTDNTILEHVRKLVKVTGGELILVHVADGFAARLQGQLNLADSQEMTEDEAYLNDVSKNLISEGFNVRGVLINGKDPGQAILSVAQKENVDLIAMATHGHTFVKDVILGSVADYLRHNTSIPILMIRDRVI